MTGSREGWGQTLDRLVVAYPGQDVTFGHALPARAIISGREPAGNDVASLPCDLSPPARSAARSHGCSMLLAHEFRGVAPLRVQARTVLAAKGCECGCGTLDLVPQGTDLPRSDADSPVPVEGSVFNLDGEEIGGLLLFIRDGLLATFEIFSYDKPMADAAARHGPLGDLTGITP